MEKNKMPTIEKVIAIVQYLEVSADWLLETNINIVTPEEQELLEAYQRADAGTQKSVRKLLDIPENQSKSFGLQTGKVS